MSVPTVVVAELLGTSGIEGSTDLLIGFKDPSGQQLALRISPTQLVEMIISLIQATSLAPQQKGLTFRDVPALGSTKADFVRMEDGKYNLRLHLTNGGSLTFWFEPAHAHLLHALLQGVLHPETQTPPDGATRN
jgi:hypothetical protein